MLQPTSRKNVVNNLYVARKRTTLTEALKKQIANAFNLYLNYKHYHWQALSPHYRDLNIIFDEFANEVYGTVEELAQIVRKTDQSRVRIREFKSIASIYPSGQGTDVRKMIEEANTNVKTVIRELRGLIPQAVDDPILSNTLKKIVQLHEKHQWWLYYILTKRQGLNAEA